MGGYHEPKVPDVFTDDPPPWACDVFSDEQRERLTFTKLWQKSVAASAATMPVKATAWALSLYFSGGEDEWNDPSTARLAAEASVSRTTVVKALDHLEDVGLIERHRSRGRNRTSYCLRVPDTLQLSTARTVQQVNSSQGDEAPTVHLAPPTVHLTAPTVHLTTPNCPPGEHEGVRRVDEGDKKGGAPDGDHEDPTSSDEDSESQGQGPVADATPEDEEEGPSPAAVAVTDAPVADATPEHHHLRSGRQFAQLIADGKVTAAKASEMAAGLEPDDREQFLQGIREGAEVPA